MRQPSRIKKVPRAGKGVKDTLHSRCWQSHENTKPHNCNIYAEGLAQTHKGPVIVTSVSVSLYEFYLVDSVGHILMVSLTPVAPTILPPPLLCGSPGFASI